MIATKLEKEYRYKKIEKLRVKKQPLLPQKLFFGKNLIYIKLLSFSNFHPSSIVLDSSPGE